MDCERVSSVFSNGASVVAGVTVRSLMVGVAGAEGASGAGGTGVAGVAAVAFAVSGAGVAGEAGSSEGGAEDTGINCL